MRRSANRGQEENNNRDAYGNGNGNGRGVPRHRRSPVGRRAQNEPLVDDVLTNDDTPEDERVEDVAQTLVAVGGALLVGVLYLALPDIVALGPRWLPLVLEAILLAPIVITHVLTPGALLPFKVARALAMALLFVVTGALIGSVVLLVLHITALKSGAALLHPTALLWAINILVWAVWYWEIDGNGPRERHRHRRLQATDFIFPQLAGGNPSGWRPGFVDYLFLAFCSSTTLGPADTFPLTHRAKLLMMVESGLSLLIVAVLVSRAVGILA